MIRLFVEDDLTDIDTSTEVGSFEATIDTVEADYKVTQVSVNSTNLAKYFKGIRFQPETINLDYSGGDFSPIVNNITDIKVLNIPYDPTNSNKTHNNKVIKTLETYNNADTITSANLLNVVEDRSTRIKLLKICKSYLKSGGTAYFSFVTGNSQDKNDEALMNKIKAYGQEIKTVFSNVSLKDMIIIAK